MASRKVLINYHSTKNEAPAVANVYEGELVVSHPSTAISATTIWTKNGDVMVPFASCAMTKIMIDAAVQEASKTVDVKTKDGEAFIKVETGGTEAARVFTLSSSGVASSTDLATLSGAAHTKITNLSAGTVSKLTSLTNVVSALTDVVVTGISGDSIIVATKVENSTGSNTYNLTHKTGKQTSGFNKLTTDTYGHVTASAAVAASDIEGLGFKSSAWTEEKIASAITALDSSTAVTAGKYITGIAIKDGQISGITEENLPAETQLSTATTGNGNVISNITVSDHEITLVKNVTAATSAQVTSLSASVVTNRTNLNTLSGAAHNKITSLSAATTAISKSLTDLSAVTLTGVSMNGAEVSVADHVATLGTVITAETQLSKTVSGNGNVFTDIAVNNHAIVINKGITALTGVSTPNSDNYLSVSVSSNSAITVGEKNTVVADKTALGNVSATGSLVDAKAVKDYVGDIVSSSVNYKGATGTLPASPSKGDLWIAASAMTASSKSVEVGDFIIYNGSSWDVIEKNLDGAVTGNLTANTVTLGDGEHTVKSLANGTKGQVLAISGTSNTPTWVNAALTDTATTHDGHYAPTGSTTGGTTATTATSAIKGLVYDDKGHVTEVITGSVLTSQTSITTKDGTTANTAAAVITAVTTGSTAGHQLTLNKTNKIFSASTADEAVKTKSALTFTFADGSADVVFDGSANKTVNIPQNTDTATTETGHYTPATSASTKGTTAATANFIKGIRIDSKNHVIDVVTGTVVTAETAIAVTNNAATNTASAVVSSVASGGTKGHSLTISKTNKIFSAATADSAVTATSAKTSESAVTASSAAKVANALSISGYATSESAALDTAIAYDGSAKKSLTFGTNTAAGKSMSMTSAGLVDVEIIDCGTY